MNKKARLNVENCMTCVLVFMLKACIFNLLLSLMSHFLHYYCSTTNVSSKAFSFQMPVVNTDAFLSLMTNVVDWKSCSSKLKKHYRLKGTTFYEKAALIRKQ